jgi:hypothetical protein
MTTVMLNGGLFHRYDYCAGSIEGDNTELRRAFEVQTAGLHAGPEVAA